MKARKITLMLLLAGTVAAAQSLVQPDTLAKKNRWDKKFYWGVTFNNSWATIKGVNLPNSYFWKPSVGASINTEYYVHKNFGLTVGVRYQQKGSGIVTPDYDHSLGNPDSTYRARIKLHALEVPLTLVVRSGEIIRNTRFQGCFGIAPMVNFKSKFVQYSVEDGFHVVELQNNRYYKNDLPLTASAGIDINAGNSCIFQIHFYGTWGTKNVYTNYYANADGKTRVLGLKLGWMF